MTARDDSKPPGATVGGQPLGSETMVGEKQVVLSSRMTTAFPYVAIQEEENLRPYRPEPEWEEHMAKKLLKRQMRTKRQGSGRRVRSPPREARSPTWSPESRNKASCDSSVPKDFLEWHREGDLRVGPELVTKAAPPSFQILPHGKVYCNVLFSLLNAKDKITYTWIAPNGRRVYRKTLLKNLSQRQTWSWNYFELFQERLRGLSGHWVVKVCLNGKRVFQASFHLLQDWIDVDNGLLPVILLCPHGGRVMPANCSPRSADQGDDRGCKETVEFVHILKDHLTYMFHVSPTVITCKVHRRWLDVDAVSQSAYLDEKMAPYYHAYYQSILMSIQHTMKVQRRYPLILCFRAHHDFEDIIYVSTLNGETVAGISERGECGDVRFTNEGLNARLEAGKYNVLPANAYQRDHTEHRAGNLVRTFGRDHHWSTDAFDMICPETMCQGYSLRPLTRDVAESLGCMYATFVHDEYCYPTNRTDGSKASEVRREFGETEEGVEASKDDQEDDCKA